MPGNIIVTKEEGLNKAYELIRDAKELLEDFEEERIANLCDAVNDIIMEKAEDLHKEVKRK